MCQGASTEKDKLKPWTGVAEFKLKVEEALPTIAKCDLVILLGILCSFVYCSLKYIIVRPAIVYGKGDLNGLSALQSYAACFK